MQFLIFDEKHLAHSTFAESFLDEVMADEGANHRNGRISMPAQNEKGGHMAALLVLQPVACSPRSP